MAKNENRYEKTKKKGGELPFLKKGNGELKASPVDVSSAEKRTLEFASSRRYKDALELVDGYASCVEKKWIDPETKELTALGREALTTAMFGGKK